MTDQLSRITVLLFFHRLEKRDSASVSMAIHPPHSLSLVDSYSLLLDKFILSLSRLAHDVRALERFLFPLEKIRSSSCN